MIKDLKKTNLEVTDEGNIEDFLGLNIESKEGKIKLSQPHLIEQVIKDLVLNHDKLLSKPIPAASSNILFAHKEYQPFDNSFHHILVIGKLKYLEKSCRPDIFYIVHQCARLSIDPRKEYGQALRWLGKYVKDNINKGTTLQSEKGRGLEVWVDADFSGNWNRSESEDRDTAISRHGYVIMYEGFPILHKYQLQTEIALSSTESEYNCLFYALREAIPIMILHREFKKRFHLKGSNNKDSLQSL